MSIPKIWKFKGPARKRDLMINNLVEPYEVTGPMSPQPQMKTLEKFALK